MPRALLSLFPIASLPTALICALLTGGSAQADFHLWFIKEIFSNSNGTVQYIELFTNSAGQQNLNPLHTITSTSSPPFSFPNDTPSPTNGRHLLIGTASVGLIPGGAAADYTIPNNFFNPAGDTINFGEGTSVRTFGAGTPLPTDGVNSLNWTGFVSPATSLQNSPRNHANQGTTMTPGDYNGNGIVDAADYTVWRDTTSQSPTAGTGADGNASGTIDVGDYDFWKTRFGNAAPGSASVAGAYNVPEPSSASRILLAVAVAALRFRGKPSPTKSCRRSELAAGKTA